MKKSGLWLMVALLAVGMGACDGAITGPAPAIAASDAAFSHSVGSLAPTAQVVDQTTIRAEATQVRHNVSSTQTYATEYEFKLCPEDTDCGGAVSVTDIDTDDRNVKVRHDFVLVAPGTYTVEVRARVVGATNDWSPWASTAQVVVEPSKQDQTITFPQPDDVIFSVGGTVALNATASSGLPVTYTSLTGAVCGISGSDATMLKAGTCTIRASQDGDEEYNPADDVERSFDILPWTFEGFYSPVRDDVINRARSGSTVLLRFQLWAGATEITSTTGISFRAVQINCTEAGDVVNEEDVFSTSGRTELRYEDGSFKQNWQTPRDPNACYRATATAPDGSTLSANFMLAR